jgi:FixJ family two-component response regulator
MTYKALSLDTDTYLEKNLPAQIGLEIKNTHSAKQFLNSVEDDTPDIVLLHLDSPVGVANKQVMSELRKHNIPAILIITGKLPKDINELLDPLIDFVRSPVDPAELQTRIEKLLHPLDLHKSLASTSKTHVNIVPMSELHSEATGRLNAISVANFYGLSVAEMARILKRPVTSIHKTPDSISLQSSLYPFERIASTASYVRGKDNLPCSFKIWLNAPNRQFGMTPLDVIRHGKVEMLADWVEDAILGLPD